MGDSQQQDTGLEHIVRADRVPALREMAEEATSKQRECVAEGNEERGEFYAARENICRELVTLIEGTGLHERTVVGIASEARDVLTESEATAEQIQRAAARLDVATEIRRRYFVNGRPNIQLGEIEAVRNEPDGSVRVVGLSGSATFEVEDARVASLIAEKAHSAAPKERPTRPSKSVPKPHGD